MKNTKYIIVDVFLILVGLILLLITLLISKKMGTEGANILYGIGTSFMAGGIVSLIDILIDNSKSKRFDKLVKWGLEDIYPKRSEINKECDEVLSKHPREIEFISFGLENFRSSTETIFKEALQRKMSAKFLVPDPNSDFVKQQEIEEQKSVNSISNSIKDLKKWIDNFKTEFPRNTIEIKFYKSLPMFSYQRMDDVIFVGPNLFGKVSQKAITFKFENNGEGYRYFKKMFDELWNNPQFCVAQISDGEQSERNRIDC